MRLLHELRKSGVYAVSEENVENTGFSFAFCISNMMNVLSALALVASGRF